MTDIIATGPQGVDVILRNCLAESQAHHHQVRESTSCGILRFAAFLGFQDQPLVRARLARSRFRGNGFAGDDLTKARYYPEDKEFLLELEPTVQHYEILVGQLQQETSVNEQR